MLWWLLVVLAISFSVASLATSAWIFVARRYQIVDHPSQRGAHSRITPRGGGVAIVIVSLLGILPLNHFGILHFSPLVLVLLFGGLAVGLLGVLDDIYSLRARSRFLIQIVIALCSVYWLPDLPDFPMIDLVDWPAWLVVSVAVLSVIWSINLFNFMDGINGLAGSEATFVLLGAALILSSTGQFDHLGLLVLIVGSVLGFLLFNFPNAKVFMGDSGSCFLGYTIAIFALGSSSADSISPWSWVILYGVFVVDTTVTLLVRIVTGQEWYRPHNLHAYQKYARQGSTHARVTGIIMSVNIIWCWPLAALATIYHDYSLMLVFIALAPIVFWVLKLRPGRVEAPPARN